MKKILIFLLVVVVVVPLFSGAQSESKKPVVIDFWTHEDASRQSIEERYIAEFLSTRPDVTVNVTRMSSSKMKELVPTAFAAGAGPTIFNLRLSYAWPLLFSGRLAKMDYKAAGYQNLQGVLDAYAPGTLDGLMYEGDLYGLPMEFTNWCLFVNKRVFASAGLNAETDYPKTWEEMAKISKQLSLYNGDILLRRGFDFRYPDYLEFMVPMVEQLGGDLFSADGKEVIIGKEAWIKVLRYMQQWGPSGQNLGSPTYTAARNLFNHDNNDIGMALTGMYQMPRIRNDNEEFYESGDWMVVPFPQWEDAVRNVANCYYISPYWVNADANNATQKAAWELIGYMLSHEEEYLEVVSLVQPKKTLLESKTYKNMPYADVFTSDLSIAHVEYHAGNSTELRSLLRTAVEGVMLQNVSPEDAYQKLKTTAQELIDENL